MTTLQFSVFLQSKLEILPRNSGFWTEKRTHCLCKLYLALSIRCKLTRISLVMLTLRYLRDLTYGGLYQTAHIQLEL